METFANQAVTTLSAAITTTNAASCSVIDATAFPATGNFRIKIDGGNPHCHRPGGQYVHHHPRGRGDNGGHARQWGERHPSAHEGRTWKHGSPTASSRTSTTTSPPPGSRDDSSCPRTASSWNTTTARPGTSMGRTAGSKRRRSPAGRGSTRAMPRSISSAAHWSWKTPRSIPTAPSFTSWSGPSWRQGPSRWPSPSTGWGATCPSWGSVFAKRAAVTMATSTATASIPVRRCG